MNLENFKNHVVFDKLEQLKQIIFSKESKNKIEIEHFNFIESTYNFICDRLKLVHPILIQEQELIGLSNEIESGTSHLNSFLGDNNYGHISNVENNFHSALNRLRNLPLILSKNDFDFSKESANFENNLINSFNKLNQLNQELFTEIENIQSSLKEKNNQIDLLNQQLLNKENEIQNNFNSYQNDFENIKNNQKHDFDNEKKSFETQFKGEVETFKIDFEKERKNIEVSSDLTIQSLNLKLEEAKKIVNIVSNVGVTGNYQNIAERHKKSANFFRWTALSFMIVMSLLLIYSIIELSTDDFNIYKSLVRIIAASVLTYPAIYASKESTKHRNLETYNRNLELELASIGPFIELLPETKKELIKENLVNKYFGNHNNIPVSEKAGIEGISLDSIDKLLKTFKSISK